MTNQELAAALRLCGGTSGVEECRAECPFFSGADVGRCVPVMTAACADALENHESHVAALLKEIEKLRGQNETLQAIATRLQPKSQWVSVAERIPDNDGLVLTYSATGEQRVLSHERGKRDWTLSVNLWHHFLIPGNSVTHWMPLPEGPEEAKVDG